MVSIREFEQSKCDVLFLYNLKEARRLKNLGELPENIKINENIDLVEKDNEEDIGVDIAEHDDDEEEEIKKEKFKNDFDENFKFI